MTDLKQKLLSRATFGVWLTLEAPTLAEIAVSLGLDWVVIDTEHGHLDFKEVVEHVRATARSQTAALVRVPKVDEGAIKRVLDIGADGVLVPMVRSAADVEQALRCAKYPPAGIRGLGAERATMWGRQVAQYTATANDRIMVIPVIETREAADDFDAILKVPGLDALFFGPFDLAASMGHLGQWGHPQVWPRIDAMRRKAQAAGVHTGIVGLTLDEARRRIDEGYRMISLGFDTLLFTRALGEMLEITTKDTKSRRTEEDEPRKTRNTRKEK